MWITSTGYASETIVNKDPPSKPLAQRLKRRVVRILRGFNSPRRCG